MDTSFRDSAMVPQLQAIQAEQEQGQQQNVDEEQHQRSKGIGFCSQVLLVAALCGVEMVVGFEQIYGVLILQYLDVPDSFLSFNGVTCGAVSIFMIPAIGIVTNRGSNPRRRKGISLCIGNGFCLLGFLLLAVCGFIKITMVNDVLKQKATTDNSTLYATPSPSTLSWETMSTTTASLNASSPGTLEITENGSVVTAVMSVIGVSCLDIFYSMNMSLIRAYIVECSPDFQHVKLLVMATIIQSMSGLAFSFIGVWDIPGALGSFFGIDGLAATLIFFCCSVSTIATVGTSSTILTGYFLKRKDQELMLDNETLCKANRTPNRQSRSLFNRWIKGQCQKTDTQAEENSEYNTDIFHAEETSSLTIPFLQYDSADVHNYSTMKYQSVSDDSEYDIASEKPCTITITTTNGNVFPSESSQTASLPDELNAEVNRSFTVTSVPEIQNDLENAGHFKPTIHSSSEHLSQPENSSTTSKAQNGDIHSKSSVQSEKQKLLVTSDSDKRTMKKKLVTLCVSTFFAVGTLLSYVMYVANALTIGILHGDPSALPGTEARERYLEGLRTAAMGNVTMYASYALISLINKKIIELIGENVQFVISHLGFITCVLGLVLSQREEVYFVAMVTTGFVRPAVFTLPYVLANKFIQETADQEVKNNNSQSSGKTADSSKVMSLVGFLIPCQEVIYSSLMGPLLGATGNVMVPLYYSICCSTASAISFLPLFFIK